MRSFTRGGLLGEGGSLGGQQRTGVRTKAGAIPLSQAGTSACLEGEACLTWPACWVAGVNDSAVCSGLHGRLGRGPEKRCVGIQRDQVQEETRLSLSAEPRKQDQKQATKIACSASHSLEARPGSWLAWPLSVESWWLSWPLTGPFSQGTLWGYFWRIDLLKKSAVDIGRVSSSLVYRAHNPFLLPLGLVSSWKTETIILP